MIFDQHEYEIRCEWGLRGVQLLAPISDVLIIVDVLSFSTAVEFATSQGAIVYPYHWRDSSASAFANSIGAELADRENQDGYSLSPASLFNLPENVRLVIPSPNGSELSLSAGSTPTIAGCLRNCRAVADFASRSGKKIAVVPAGERWEDDSLRPCIEDLLGAGAIISYLNGNPSPEALVARRAFEGLRTDLAAQLIGSSSGKEKLLRGEGEDIRIAAELNASDCVPILIDGAFRKKR